MIKVNYEMNAGKVDWVKIENVASFLHSEALTITDDYLGELQFDVSYGGNFYAIFDPQPNFKGLEHFSASDLIMHAKRIRAQINADYPNRFVHPEDALYTEFHMYCGQELHLREQRLEMRYFMEIKL